MNEPAADKFARLLNMAGFDKLTKESPLSAIEKVLKELARTLENIGADAVYRGLAREGAIRSLKAAGLRAPAALVNDVLAVPTSSAVAGNTASLQGRAATFVDPEPWPEPVTIATLLALLSH